LAENNLSSYLSATLKTWFNPLCTGRKFFLHIAKDLLYKRAVRDGPDAFAVRESFELLLKFGKSSFLRKQESGLFRGQI